MSSEIKKEIRLEIAHVTQARRYHVHRHGGLQRTLPKDCTRKTVNIDNFFSELKRRGFKDWLMACAGCTWRCRVKQKAVTR
jgi:uncharacterized Fe-S radical SAM superfamily protein PflX